jgi:1-acyl-sn-glycerol-3-phosphate acyltransferase
LIRFAWRALLIVLGLLVCVPLHYLSLPFGRSRWPRRFLGWVAYAAGMRVRAEGRPLEQSVLFLANHLSWLDIMVLAGASGTAFVAKEEVGQWPVIGWLARLNRSVFVARSARSAVRHQADSLRAALASGLPVALFPEGTTEGGVEILPFRASLVASLFPPIPGVLLQPVALDYGDAAHDIAWVGDEGAFANARRILSRPGTADVLVRFLAPIDPAEAGDRKVLAARARDEILDALRPAPSGPAADRL